MYKHTHIHTYLNVCKVKRDQTWGKKLLEKCISRREKKKCQRRHERVKESGW